MVVAVVVVGGVVGGEPGILIVVGSQVRNLPGGCVEAGEALTAGLKTFNRPEEHQKQMGEEKLHREAHTDVSCVGGVLLSASWVTELG